MPREDEGPRASGQVERADRTTTRSTPVSVIIPIRNAVSTLPDLLASLAAQDDLSFEVVVADNDSSDGSGALAWTFRDRFAHLVVVDASCRRGPGFARRAGAEVASGEFLLFVDADDEVSPRYVGALAQALTLDDFVHAAMDMKKLNPDWFVEHDAGLGNTTPDVGGWKYAFGGTLGVRRDAYDRSGGWSPEYHVGDDVDFCWRMRAAGYDLRCVPEAVLHRRGRHSSAGSWQQGRWYGTHHAISNRMWKPYGLAVESEWTLARRACTLALTVRSLRSPTDRPFWLKEAGLVSARAQHDLTDRLFSWRTRDALDVRRPSKDPALERFRRARSSRAS